MSCNGCRALRKRCSEDCILRTSLQWIHTSDAQSNATLFVAKFFGRADLISFLSAVPHHHRPVVLQSLLFEACGRTVNPVSGAVGLLCSGNWRICQDAFDTVLSGGILRPVPFEFLAGESRCKSSGMPDFQVADSPVNRGRGTTPFESDVSEECFENEDNGDGERKLLNLFV